MPRLILQELRVAHVGPVSLDIMPAEIVCISGASGSGKSLLLRAIADIIPHQGQVLLDAQAANSVAAPSWRRQVGLLPAENQWWYDSVHEHFATRDSALLSALGFSESTWDWELARCSSGEKQRLALLRQLSREPRCLLLDEPTASLDPESIERVENVLHNYIVQRQSPVLWVSHSRDQIRRVAARHFVMHDGKLEAA